MKKIKTIEIMFRDADYASSYISRFENKVNEFLVSQSKVINVTSSVITHPDSKYVTLLAVILYEE